MSELDPNLQAMFTHEPIADAGFSSSVISKVREKQRREKIVKSAILLAALSMGITAAVQFGLAESITYSLTLPIFNLGEGWLGWAMSPLNNVGALLVMLLNLFRLTRRSNSEWRVNLLPF